MNNNADLRGAGSEQLDKEERYGKNFLRLSEVRRILWYTISKNYGGPKDEVCRSGWKVSGIL